MNHIYESTNSAATIYAEWQTTTVLHGGRRYRLLGESLGQQLSLNQHVEHVMAIVGLVAASIFTGGLALIGLVSTNCRQLVHRLVNELRVNAETNFHYVLQTPEPWQRDTVRPFIQQLEYTTNADIPGQLFRASCCLAIQFNHGEPFGNIPHAERPKVKKQFLFRNHNDAPFTKAELIQKINGMHNELAASIENEIDVATTALDFACVLLYQEAPENEVRASYTSSNAHMQRGIPNRVLPFVYANPQDVISRDRMHILAGPGCISL